MSSARIVFLGLSITSSWGNGHAGTYRALLRALHRAGHDCLFLERDRPWYAQNRDLPDPPYCRLGLYDSIKELRERWLGEIRDADLVVVGSYVPEGCETGRLVQEHARGVKAFYDIDTPVTLAKLQAGDHEYLHPDLIPGYDIYFSFTGGPTLDLIEYRYHSPRALPLYCSTDPAMYYPEARAIRWDLGYMGTFSEDRQPGVERLMLAPARDWPAGRFVIAGPQFPDHVKWPPNLERIFHLPPPEHRAFYSSQRFTLNVTRADMIAAGYSPSVRLFEAAACAVPVISDYWPGLESFFELGTEVLIPAGTGEALSIIRSMSDRERNAIGRAAREKFMNGHTPDHRARELIGALSAVRSPRKNLKKLKPQIMQITQI